MQVRRAAWVAVAVVVALGVSTGCVSKKLFRKNVQETDERISDVQSGVEENERRITDLSQSTDAKIAQAQGTAERAVEIGNAATMKAEEASKLAQEAARGKLLWDITLSDESVKFSFGGASLPAGATARLDELIGQVKASGKAVYVEIEGHTDNIGSEEYNLELSAKRAEAVRLYLHEKGGIPLHAISVLPYGESKPIAENSSPDGRSRNRRVVIRVLE